MRMHELLLCFSAALLFRGTPADPGRGQTQQSAAAQVHIPDTPAGKRLAEWLKAFNSSDLEAVRAFRDTAFKDPPRRPLSAERDFREQTGGFELRGILESSSSSISAELKERNSEQFARIHIEVEGDEPHRIIGFDLGGTPRPSTEPSQRMSEGEALNAADKRTAELCGAGQFSGVMMIARNGRELLSRACGLADAEKKIPNRVGTRFNLGSMNKMFTAMAIMQLVEQGKVGLEDPVGTYLTGYPNRDVASKVTIHELLTHTGGTGDIFGPEFQKNRDKLRTPADYVALYGTRAPEFEPGSRFEYSNYGFVLLGAVIEKVSGKSYYDFVREHIYQPAGMKDSDSYFAAAEVPNRAIGYTRQDPGSPLQPNTPGLAARGSPAGGGYSTAEDLVKFAKALLDHQLLNAQSIELLTTGKVGPWGRRYAYGFQDEQRDGARMIGHNGGSQGTNAELNIYPESGYVVVVLANVDPPAAGRLAQFIGARLPAK